MKSQINLVSPRSHSRKGMSRFLVGSIGIFVVSFFISMSVILYIFYLRSNLSALDVQEGVLRSQISSQLTKKTNILLLRERLTNAQKITDARKNLNIRLNAILGLLPLSTGVGGIDATNEKISVNLTSSDLGDINTLLEEKIVNFTKDSRQVIARIDVKSLGRSTTTSNYNLALEFEYTKTK